MIVCQINQELELLTVQYVKTTSELLKTRMVGLMERLGFRNIAQKTAGLSGQLFTLIVVIVANKSRQLKVRISNIVIWIAEIVATSIKLANRLVLGKAKKHLILQYINGFIHIIKNQIYATTVRDKVTPSGLTYHRSTTEKEMIGLTYVSPAISSLMEIITRTLDDISDVIRKRYWKFVNGSEDGWEDNTKAVD